MAVTQLYTAVAGHVITTARWNNEFANIYNNGTALAFPATKAISFAGYTITLDAVDASTLRSITSSGLVFVVGGKTGTPSVVGGAATLTASTFTDNNTAASGTAALYTGMSVRTPTIAANATNVTITDAYTMYIAGAPTAGANQTITTRYAGYFGGNLYCGNQLITVAGSDIAAASTIAVTVSFATVTGTTTITGISTVNPSGAVIRLRFTGAGLNLTHNATSFIAPFGRDYRTVPNEIIEFISLGSGNYRFYSLNGPSERPGISVEVNTTAIPAGYLAEDGSAVSRTTYAGLFAEIGTTFGVGDGSTTFNVPDTRGRAIINVDGAANNITAASTGGGNADTLGGTGGDETHSLVSAEMPAHTHTLTVFGTDNVTATPLSSITNTGTTATNSSGSGTAHSNTQPWMVKTKCIRF